MKQMCVIVIFVVLITACVVDPETIRLWGGDVTVPVLNAVYTISPRELTAEFSNVVSVTDAGISCEDDPDRVIAISWNRDSCSEKFVFTLSENPGIGVVAVLQATVQDSGGNSLSFAVPFTGFNERVPRLIINEMRTKYDKPKVEYLEFLAVTDGNLAGVEIQNTMNSVKSFYEFPSCEVRAGDYILWHLRTIEEDVCDEKDRIDASGGKDSSMYAWDFWDAQERAPLKATNVLFVRERKGGQIMDALVCAESTVESWPTESLAAAAEEAVAAGAWKPSALITDAACSDYMTPTRTLGRIPGNTDTDTAGDWMICATSGASPGMVNSSVPHVIP